MANEIVVGYDGAEGARAAAPRASSSAKDLGAAARAGVRLRSRAAGAPVRATTSTPCGVGREGHRRGGGARDSAGVEAEAEVVSKPAEGPSRRYADERDARMIVVGSHGERPLAGALLGSVPHKLLHISETPVLVVRADRPEPLGAAGRR